jgi:hypothetical protein
LFSKTDVPPVNITGDDADLDGEAATLHLERTSFFDALFMKEPLLLGRGEMSSLSVGPPRQILKCFLRSSAERKCALAARSSEDVRGEDVKEPISPVDATKWWRAPLLAITSQVLRSIP